MNKLSNLFLNKAYRITQTTHGHNAHNTQDLKYQRAVDCVFEPFNILHPNIYAQADGVIEVAKNNAGKPDSFIQVRYDGLKYPKQYVHAYPIKGIMAGKRVKRGERIGKLCGLFLNWYGFGKHHFIHLHDAFYDASGKGLAPNPFDYLDRSTKVITNSAEIKKLWFVNGKFNWSLFKDLKLKVITMSEVPTDPCEALRKENELLVIENKDLKQENLDLKAENTLLKSKMQSAIKELS